MDVAGVALDVWSYSSLIKGFVQSSELQSALEILQEMKEASHVTANEVRCCSAACMPCSMLMCMSCLCVGCLCMSCWLDGQLVPHRALPDLCCTMLSKAQFNEALSFDNRCGTSDDHGRALNMPVLLRMPVT